MRFVTDGKGRIEPRPTGELIWYQVRTKALDDVKRRRLSRQAVACFAALTTYSDDAAKPVWPSQETLAAELGCSVDSVQRYLSELEQSVVIVKWVNRPYRKGADGPFTRHPNRYHFVVDVRWWPTRAKRLMPAAAPRPPEDAPEPPQAPSVGPSVVEAPGAPHGPPEHSPAAASTDEGAAPVDLREKISELKALVPSRSTRQRPS